MKILYITANYPPDSSPGAIRAYEFSKGLAKHGIESIILREQIHEDRAQVEWVETTVEAMPWLPSRTVRKTNSIPGFAGGLSTRLRNLATLMDDGYHTIDVLVRTAENVCLKEQPDLIFVSCNPMSSAVAAYRLKALTGLPLVIEFRDPWMDNPTRIWQTRIHFELERYMEQKAYAAADHIIFNTALAASMMCERYPEVSPDQVSYLHHCWSATRFGQIKNQHEPLQGDKFVIGVGGGVYRATRQSQSLAVRILNRLKYQPPGVLQIDPVKSSLKPLFTALARLVGEQLEIKHKIEVCFLRDLTPEDAEYVTKLGLQKNVSSLGGVPADEVPGVLNQFGCLYLNHVIFGEKQESPFVASRTFDYLATGKPILAHLPPGEGLELVWNSGLGKMADPYDSESLYVLMKQLLKQYFDQGIPCKPNKEFIQSQEATHRIAELAAILKKASTAPGS